MKTIKHVAIIMDGNGRWGLKKRGSRHFGHLSGFRNLENIVDFSIKKKISYLTLFAFSTENWKRPESEIKYLFDLIRKYFKKKISSLMEKGARIKIIGNKNKLPKDVRKIISNVEKITKKNKKIQILLALNYGSKEEIVNSFKKLIKKKVKKVSVKQISNYLYTSRIPDPEILIRTGGYFRLSNFLLWQSAYSELFFLKKLWPDFKEKDFSKVIQKYYKIKRNFGSL